MTTEITSECLHFLTVYIDDILTCHRQIEDNNTLLTDVIDQFGYSNYEKSWNVYQDKAMEMLSEMDGILTGKEDDISLAYYFLYASYFHHLMNDQTKALF